MSEDALNLLQRISVDLLVNGKIIESTPAQVRALQHLLTGFKDQALLSNLQELADQPASAEAYCSLLSTLDEISGRLRRQNSSAPEIASENSNCEMAEESSLLRYDTSQDREILESFFSEVSGHLQNSEQQLLHLEQHPSDAAALHAIFGAMHSLKGIAGFLDLKWAHVIAHEAESVMSSARSRECIQPDECDAILAAVDVLRDISSRVQAHSRTPGESFPPAPLECAMLRDRLRNLAEYSEPSPTELRAISVSATPAPTEMDTAKPVISDANPTAERAPTKVVDNSALVRVKVEKLDSLVDFVGELVVMQAQIEQDPALKGVGSERLMRNLGTVNKIVRDLQEVALSLRMFPLRETFGRMSRLARDVAQKCGKNIELSVSGENTELDKNVIEALVDPLSHLVRNAVDHGIGTAEQRIASGKPERGVISIDARYQGGQVVIEVSDDGQGLDLERIRNKAFARGMIESGKKPSDEQTRAFIFMPGFSTRDTVTDVSGRGVGLDVVKRNVESLGGNVTVSSIMDKGTRFTLSLPLTLSVIDGLVVRAGSERYIIPITSVIESLRPLRSQCATVHQRGELIDLRGTSLPLIRLHEYARSVERTAQPWEAMVVIVDCRGERFALLIDELVGQQQVVVKSLGDRLRGTRGVLGGAILGDGRIGLILDVAEVLEVMKSESLLAT